MIGQLFKHAVTEVTGGGENERILGSTWGLAVTPVGGINALGRKLEQVLDTPKPSGF